jgi:hypothetical protein
VPSTVGQVTWQSPSRTAFTRGWHGFYNQKWGAVPATTAFTALLINFSDQANDSDLSYRQPGSYQHNWTGQQIGARQRPMTGANSAKFGYYGIYDQPTTNTENQTGFSNPV